MSATSSIISALVRQQSPSSDWFPCIELKVRCVIRKKTKNHVAPLFLPEGVGSNGTESDLFTMSKYPARERCRIQTKPNFALYYTRYSVSGLGNHRTQPKNGGARRDRTDDILLAKQALSQLSYGPIFFVTVQFMPKAELVGPGRLELPTSRLSGVRSNHLSYGPPDVIWTGLF